MVELDQLLQLLQLPELVDLVLVLAAVLLAAAAARWLLADLRALPAPSSDGGPTSGAAVSVVVPARDEEASLPTLLGSLRRQTVPVTEVVVVDDGSRDGTARVAADGGATVLDAGDPPRGWTGKAWACHTGARATSGDVLLFLDADTELAPDALAGLLALHAEHGGLVSVQPHHRVVRPYESLSAYFNAVAVLASGAFARRAGRRPMAFGPCLLTRRDDLATAGGHAAVRGAILDDVALAVAYRRAGLPVRCVVGGSRVAMRSYPGGPRQLAAGWTKNMASGAAATDPRAALAAVLWVGAHHAVAVGTLTALVTTAASPSLPSLGWAVPWLVLWAGAAAQLRSVLRRIGSFPWWAWVLFPVPLLAFDVLFGRSAVLTLVRRSVRWRGRPVDLRGPSAGEAR